MRSPRQYDINRGILLPHYRTGLLIPIRVVTPPNPQKPRLFRRLSFLDLLSIHGNCGGDGGAIAVIYFYCCFIHCKRPAITASPPQLQHRSRARQLAFNTFIQVLPASVCHQTSSIYMRCFEWRPATGTYCGSYTLQCNPPPPTPPPLILAVHAVCQTNKKYVLCRLNHATGAITSHIHNSAESSLHHRHNLRCLRLTPRTRLTGPN